jgi:hypothetical protein
MDRNRNMQGAVHGEGFSPPLNARDATSYYPFENPLCAL